MIPFVPAFVPNLLQVAPFAIAFALLCAKPLRCCPGPFYVFWTLSVVAVTWSGPVVSVLGSDAPAFATVWQAQLEALPSTAPLLDAVVQLVTSAYTGVCLCFIVMFAGALERTPWVKRLLSVRSELSVIAGIVIAAHLVRVAGFLALSLTPMWPRIWGQPAAGVMFAAAVVVGLPLTATFLVPWITSFKAVRKRLSAKTWKRTQLLAYPFVALMAAQGFLLAVGHLLHGYPYDGLAASAAFAVDPAGWLATFAGQVFTAWMYLVLGASYAVLRLRKRSRDKARREAAVSSAVASGAPPAPWPAPSTAS